MSKSIRATAAAEGADYATTKAACRKAEAAYIKASFGGAGVQADRLSPAPPVHTPGAARKMQRGAAVSVERGGGAVAALRAHLRSG